MQRDGEADSVVLSGGRSWELANFKIPEPMFSLLSQCPKLIMNACVDQKSENSLSLKLHFSKLVTQLIIMTLKY